MEQDYISVYDTVLTEEEKDSLKILGPALQRWNKAADDLNYTTDLLEEKKSKRTEKSVKLRIIQILSGILFLVFFYASLTNNTDVTQKVLLIMTIVSVIAIIVMFFIFDADHKVILMIVTIVSASIVYTVLTKIFLGTPVFIYLFLIIFAVCTAILFFKSWKKDKEYRKALEAKAQAYEEEKIAWDALDKNALVLVPGNLWREDAVLRAAGRLENGARNIRSAFSE